MARLTVIAHPGSRQARIGVDEAGRVVVWVRERAEDGRANAAVERALAAHLALPLSEVRIARGQTARLKLVDVPLDEVAALALLRSGR